MSESLIRPLARSLLWEALFSETPIPAPHQPCVQRRLRINGRPERWTRAAILSAIQRFVALTGAVPADPEFRHPAQHQLPARMSVMKFWPTLADAIRAAGYVPIPNRRRPPPNKNKQRR